MSPAAAFDVVVIGSGFGGAVTACRLAGLGLDVCILERGRRYQPSDLPVLPDETFWPPTDGGQERKLPDFSRAFWQLGQGLWDVRDLGDLVVGQAAGFGGGSLIYANVHLRPPAEVFDDWPAGIDAAALKDYFDLAAFMLDVQEPPGDLPKTGHLERVASELPDGLLETFRPPLAVNFAAKKNRFGRQQKACDMRGECWLGCKQQAKNTLDLNYLAAAEESGAEVRTLAEVDAIEHVGGDFRYKVTFRNHLKRGAKEHVGARYVFLCAGAVNTTELLMRSRDAIGLDGRTLGMQFHPNADDLAVVFNCDEEQEADRGPTITSSLLYDDGESWLLIQDGGLPTHLEPFLGIFRSPLWLHRNGFVKPGAGTSTGEQVALPQRVGYAELPVDSIIDIIADLSGSAVAPVAALGHDISRGLVDLARQQPSLVSQFVGEPAEDDPKWSLCPKQLRAALEELRKSTLADVTLASEPFVENLIQRAAARVPEGVLGSLREMTGRFDVVNVREEELRQWALRLAIQLLWGSQAGLLGAIANLFNPFVDAQRVILRVSDFLKWAFDYRAGDGHAAVLLTFGRDSRPSTLELVTDELPFGTVMRGADSQARGRVTAASRGILTLAEVHGDFRVGEVLLADSRPLGTCASYRRQSIEAGPVIQGRAQALSAIAVLSIEYGDAVDERRFRTDSYRIGEWENARAESESVPALRARLPAARRTPERGIQERLLRDIAKKLGGELRTSPLWPFLGRRLTVHGQGGCPMADDPTEGVTAPSGKVHGCDGLYVMDAAAFPKPVGVNPSATIAALAEWKIEQFIHDESADLASFICRRQGEGDRRGEKKGIRVRDERDSEGERKAEEERKGEELAVWNAPEKSDARKWAAERPYLDPLGSAAKGGRKAVRPQPESKPIGVEFHEIMTGTHRRYEGRDGRGDLGPELAIETDLTVSVDDLSAFLAADREGEPRPLRIDKGTVGISWDGGKMVPHEVRVEGSHLKVLSGSDDRGNPTRSLEYVLWFWVPDDPDRAEGTGRMHVLDGVKDIRDDARFDVWEDTTTLTFLLGREPASRSDGSRKHQASQIGGRMRKVGDVDTETYGWGVVRLPAANFFGDQLGSFRATNTEDDPARQAWALAAFGRFFFGHLVDVYLPSLGRVADVARQVVGRGHV